MARDEQPAPWSLAPHWESAGGAGGGRGGCRGPRSAPESGTGWRGADGRKRQVAAGRGARPGRGGGDTEVPWRPGRGPEPGATLGGSTARSSRGQVPKGQVWPRGRLPAEEQRCGEGGGGDSPGRPLTSAPERRDLPAASGLSAVPFVTSLAQSLCQSFHSRQLPAHGAACEGGCEPVAKGTRGADCHSWAQEATQPVLPKRLGCVRGRGWE